MLCVACMVWTERLFMASSVEWRRNLLEERQKLAASNPLVNGKQLSTP